MIKEEGSFKMQLRAQRKEKMFRKWTCLLFRTMTKKFIRFFQIFRFLYHILADLLATVQQSMPSVLGRNNLG